jgi:hypothetical protein
MQGLAAADAPVVHDEKALNSQEAYPALASLPGFGAVLVRVSPKTGRW